MCPLIAFQLKLHLRTRIVGKRLRLGHRGKSVGRPTETPTRTSQQSNRFSIVSTTRTGCSLPTVPRSLSSHDRAMNLVAGQLGGKDQARSCHEKPEGLKRGTLWAPPFLMLRRARVDFDTVMCESGLADFLGSFAGFELLGGMRASGDAKRQINVPRLSPAMSCAGIRRNTATAWLRSRR